MRPSLVPWGPWPKVDEFWGVQYVWGSVRPQKCTKYPGAHEDPCTSNTRTHRFIIFIAFFIYTFTTVSTSDLLSRIIFKHLPYGFYQQISFRSLHHSNDIDSSTSTNGDTLGQSSLIPTQMNSVH